MPETWWCCGQKRPTAMRRSSLRPKSSISRVSAAATWASGSAPTPAPAPRASGLDFLDTVRDVTRFTYAWSFAGVPTLAVPCGFSADGLPLSFQLTGDWFDEAALLPLWAALQKINKMPHAA